MTHLRGRALRGQRLVVKVPHGHWQTTTLIAALGIDGIVCSTTVNAAVNGDVFEAFVKQVLIPHLRPGDTMVMHNLSSHKRANTIRAIEAAGSRGRVLAAVLTRPQPDRKSIQQDQEPPAFADLPNPRATVVEDAVGS
ncbi:MAG: transposase [Planctomycetota bacterium]